MDTPIVYFNAKDLEQALLRAETAHADEEGTVVKSCTNYEKK